MAKVLAYVETRDSKIKNAGIEVASTALKFANELNYEFETLLIGNAVSEVANELGKCGIKRVLVAENDRLDKYSTTAYAKIFADVCKARNADIIFLSATALGKDLGPRVAAKLDSGLAVDCTELRVEKSEIIATRPVYAGKGYIEVKVNSSIKIYSLRPNVFKIEKTNAAEPEIEKIQVELNDSDFSCYVKEVVVSNEKIDVAEANIIVSGGRGLKGPENFYLVENLAKALNAGVGSSRAVVDAGWRPHSEQVGQTGKTVSPNLYIACGISGAIQHQAGMSSSKCIVAINKDKDAPIFQIADYGIVGDVFEILPALTEEFKKILSN
ncbi:MAG: electron transfer flavoprotein subunit alpha/FixB family protein [Ignavibacteria bacterium]